MSWQASTNWCKFWVGLFLLISPINFVKAQCFADPKAAYAYLVAEETLAKKPLINLNTAHASELITLDGVGIKTAEAIIAYRTKHGRFEAVDELQQVKGIGAKTLAKNRHRLRV